MGGDDFQHCLDAAYRYLTYRPRSEAEVKGHLRQRGFPVKVVDEAIARLKEQGLVNDLAFAQSWKDNRLSSKLKSKRLIQRELRDKKVPAEIVEQVTEDIDDENNAYKLACSRMSALAHLEYPEFYRRLSNYLGYRGFSYRVIRTTVSRLWREKQPK